MSLVEVNRNPTHRQLIQFGLIGLLALPALAWIWHGSWQLIAAATAVGAALALFSALLPGVVRPVFIAASLVAAPIGLIVGELAMLVIYFGIFLPIGMVFWLVKRDALQLTLRRQAATYWQPKKRASHVASYYRQS